MILKARNKNSSLLNHCHTKVKVSHVHIFSGIFLQTAYAYIHTAHRNLLHITVVCSFIAYLPGKNTTSNTLWEILLIDRYEIYEYKYACLFLRFCSRKYLERNVYWSIVFCRLLLQNSRKYTYVSFTVVYSDSLVQLVGFHIYFHLWHNMRFNVNA